MEKNQLLTLLKEKRELEFYLELLSKDTAVLPELLSILETEKTAVKYQAEKVVRQLSEKDPRRLYPYFMRVAGLFNSPNQFIKWGAILTLPNLLPVDSENQWKTVREAYLPFYKSQAIAEFGNAVQSVPKILSAHPEEEQTILPLLLDVDSRVFLHKGEVSPECKNVAKGHVLECFINLYARSSYQTQMRGFAKQNLENPRKQVRAKASKLLKLSNS